MHSYLDPKISSTQAGPEVIKKNSCSTGLSMTFQQLLLIKTKTLKNKIFLAFKLSDSVFIIMLAF